MKTFKIIITIYIFLFLGCKNDDNKSISTDLDSSRILQIDVDHQFNDSVKQIIRNYISENEYEEKVLMSILFCNNQEDSILLTPIYFYSEIIEKPSFSYSKIDNNIVFVYSGFSDFVNFDNNEYFVNIKKIIGNKLINNINNNGEISHDYPAYTPILWSIKKGFDGYIINKHAKPHFNSKNKNRIIDFIK